MKMIVAYIRHEAFEPIRADLLEAGFPSLSISEVKGSGRQKGITEHYRGSEIAIHLRPKLKIEIVIDDDGPGIRPDAFERIFERFYTDRPHQGFGHNSGLGLSISKQIIEAHGGRIWAENRTSVAATVDVAPHVLGARFVVRLPAM